MWGAYYSNTVTSFIIGKKKLPVYHLALISIAVLMGVFSLSLVYAAVFTGMMVEAVSLKGLCSDITKLQSEIEELRTLVEFPSTMPVYYRTDAGGWNDSSDYNRANITEEPFFSKCKSHKNRCA